MMGLQRKFMWASLCSMYHAHNREAEGQARRIARDAISDSSRSLSRTRCALVIYCAGCFLAIKEYIDQVWAGLTSELPDMPLLGQLTFGKQDVFPDGETAQGHLMVTVILWSAPPESASWIG